MGRKPALTLALSPRLSQHLVDLASWKRAGKNAECDEIAEAAAFRQSCYGSSHSPLLGCVAHTEKDPDYYTKLSVLTECSRFRMGFHNVQ